MKLNYVLFEDSILRRTREKLGLTQEQVAELANIHPYQYQRFESGNKDLSSSSFQIACRVLNALQLDISAYWRGDYVFSEETVEFDQLIFEKKEEDNAEHKPLYLKHVAFVGNFKEGSLSLKDLVYAAGGAPVDTVAAFTNYLVVGSGGETTQVYKKNADMIERGILITLTPEQLRDIAEERIAPPKPNRKRKSTVIVSETEESRKYSEDLALSMWKHKREAFLDRYGLLQPDGTRVKMKLKLLSAIEEAKKRLNEQ